MDTVKSTFTPEVLRDRSSNTYSFKFPGAGLFHCSLTGLMFKVTHEGEVTYKTLIWDTMRLEPARKVTGGPLFSIECPQDSICQLHLPHCEPEPALVADSISVAEITDDSISIIPPLEVTATHVVLDTPNLSAFGIVWDLIKRFMNHMTKPLNAQVLLYLRPPFRSGNVFLYLVVLPSNVPLQEVKVQYDNCTQIQAPADCLLYFDKHYSLFSEPGGYHIQPARAQFFPNYGPNYHITLEIALKTHTKEVTVMLRDPAGTQVWDYHLSLPGSSSPDNNSTKD